MLYDAGATGSENYLTLAREFLKRNRKNRHNNETEGIRTRPGRHFGADAIDARLKPMSQMAEIDITQIIPNPAQPRTQFDEEALDELADSIRQLGVIQPITVKKAGEGKYIIISGERRWRAAQRADLQSLPAYIREVDARTSTPWPSSRTSSGRTSTPSRSRWACSA